jgi:hypothetical protein
VVDHLPGDLDTLREGLVERRVLHNGTTRGVDEDRRRLHTAQRRAVEQVVRTVGQRCLDHQVVGAFQQLIERDGAHVPLVHFRFFDEWVVRPDLHPERFRPLCDAPGNCAERQQSQNAAAQPQDRLPRLPPPLAPQATLKLIFDTGS